MAAKTFIAYNDDGTPRAVVTVDEEAFDDAMETLAPLRCIEVPTVGQIHDTSLIASIEPIA